MTPNWDSDCIFFDHSIPRIAIRGTGYYFNAVCPQCKQWIIIIIINWNFLCIFFNNWQQSMASATKPMILREHGIHNIIVLCSITSTALSILSSLTQVWMHHGLVVEFTLLSCIPVPTRLEILDKLHIIVFRIGCIEPSVWFLNNKGCYWFTHTYIQQNL